jgi:serine/threonine-protein kinase RsbW
MGAEPSRGAASARLAGEMPSLVAETTDLTIRNDLADISILREAVDRVGTQSRIPPEAVNDLQIVLDEIVSNVIKYAWPAGGDHEVRVRLTVDGGAIEAEVIDDGQPYDPREAPAPMRAAPGRRPRPGGLGVHLAKQLVDGFDYRRVGPHNRVRLTKRFL